MPNLHSSASVHAADRTYTLVVTNVGTTATTGPITVSDPLPTGLSFVSGTGACWSFAEARGTVAATHDGPIAFCDGLQFELTLDVRQAAVPSVSNTATV